MGRLIDADRLKEVFSRNVAGGNAYFDLIDNAPTVEAIPKDQYEQRLKADLVSLLRFLWNEIEDLDAPICDYASSDCISKWQVHELIQQKINELKEQKDETDKSNK